ncbi:MAG TPA: hypothetical protein VGG79_25705 [Roseiarcus sp.]|jgi:hypothetical protein
MNLRRGSFRLWLVSATLFVGLTVVYQIQPILAEFDKAESQRIWKLKEEIPGTPEHFLGEPLNPSQEDLPARPWNVVVKTISFALGVPVLVLCAGLLIAWVGTGFRDNRAN